MQKFFTSERTSQYRRKRERRWEIKVERREILRDNMWLGYKKID